MIPQQILDTLSGEDVLLIPPAVEGTMPIESETFAVEHLEALIDLGMAVARDNAETDELATYLVFNPEVFDPAEVQQFADESRLAEFVNGAGNNAKPAAPTAIVNVKDTSGAPVRDILVDTPEKAAAAIQRNTSPKRTAELNPFNEDAVKTVVRERIQNVGAIPNPTKLPQ